MSEFTVDRRYQSELTIKRSRFIAVLAPCQETTAPAGCHASLAMTFSEPAPTVQAFLKQLAAEHPQATHLTYAFRIHTPAGLRERCHDAGEPSGTAGRTILHHLQGRQVIDACLAVVRYFGGIKLGAGGLVRAYGQAARQVLESAELRPYIVHQTLEVEVDYARFHLLAQRLASLGGSVAAVEYGAQVKARLRVPESQVETVKRLLQSH